MPKKIRVFSPEFKENAVKLSYQKSSNKELAEELGIEAHFIQRWRREYKQYGEGSFCGKGYIKIHPEEKVSYELEKKLNASKIRFEILKNATPYLYKGNEEIYRFIKSNHGKYELLEMCRVLGVGKKRYSIWKKNGPSEKKIHIASLKKDIAKIFQRSNRCYGRKEITHELNQLGYNLKETKVGFYMYQLKLRKKHKKKYIITTDSFHNHYIAPNILNRKFNVEAPSKVWASDITYLKTEKRFIYLTVIMDLFDRKIIGWNLSLSMSVANTILPAWEMAVKNRHVLKGMIFHSDRGVQYASKAFSSILDSHNCIRSMSRKWNSSDNAVCESFFSTLKKELIHKKTKLIGQRLMRKEIFEFIENWYNKKRIHSYLNYKTIEQFIAENSAAYQP
ncbi:MAG: IS3 family transposase [Flavobacterium sp.]|uniref:IS3 family transposase n=1 Tax=Flavobacterium sp. TaxID=239 RepID=UPI003D0E5F2E